MRSLFSHAGDTGDVGLKGHRLKLISGIAVLAFVMGAGGCSTSDPSANAEAARAAAAAKQQKAKDAPSKQGTTIGVGF